MSLMDMVDEQFVDNRSTYSSDVGKRAVMRILIQKVHLLWIDWMLWRRTGTYR